MDLASEKIEQLTYGNRFDTHCQWAPQGDWIVFSSSRDKPQNAPDLVNGLDPGYYGVYLVNATTKAEVRVVSSIPRFGEGHVNHPFFSPDGKSIVVTSDLASVSADPISLPRIEHSVRPYGDIFVIDIDKDNMENNKDVSDFKRITHSRFENSTAVWTRFSTSDPNAAWNKQFSQPFKPLCPFFQNGDENFYLTGHLCLPKKCC